MRGTLNLTVAAAVALSVALAGCSTAQTAPTNKAGGTGETITLRIGTDDGPGRPSASQIEEFGRRTAALSSGSVRIEPVWHAVGEKQTDWDQKVARKVVSGELEMGMVPSRAWDTEGVTSLRALNAPFLITSDGLSADVVSSDLAGELMSGLDGAGVVGLALLPEGLRHPFGLTKPLLGPADYRGEVIRTPTSTTTAAFFAALQADVSQEEADPKKHAAMESSYAVQPKGMATGNVTFWPKINSLVINKKAYDDLGGEQREALQQAATDTRTWAISTTPDDAEAARAFCALGRVVAQATSSDLKALESAAAPVYAELERDGQTRTLIQSIRDLKQRSHAPPVSAVRCGSAKPSTKSAAPVATALEGVYRYETSRQDLLDAGVTDEPTIRDHIGVYTWTLADNRWCWKWTGPYPSDNTEDCGPYTVDGDQFSWTLDDGFVETFRWSTSANGDLTLKIVGQARDPMILAQIVRPWTRIGDAP